MDVFVDEEAYNKDQKQGVWILEAIDGMSMRHLGDWGGAIQG